MVADISKALLKSDDVFVLYSIRPETPSNVRSILGDHVNAKHIQMSGFLGSISSIYNIVKEINESEPDILHCHSSFAGFVGRIASFFTGRKVIYSPHCISFMRKDLGFVKKGFFILLENIGSLFSKNYLACSKSEAHVIKKYILLAKVFRVDNAVNRKVKKRSGSIVETPSVVTVGQLRRQKNPARFARIAENLKKIDNEVVFTWVGDGELSYKKCLESVGVRVTGWLERDTVIDLLNSSSIYLSTSSWEGMPVSLIEAMQNNIPVIASTCSGNIDIIDDEVTGILFEDDDQAVDALVKLLGDESLRKKLADNAFTHSLEYHSFERYMKELKIVYYNI